MLLALGPLLLDTTDRTVVVGVLDGIAPGSMAAAAAGADVIWLRSPSPEHVGLALRETGLPVGVTDDVAALDELVASGATAVECPSAPSIDVVLREGVTLWCTPSQAEHALASGVPPQRVISEPGHGLATVSGATVAGEGPGTWGDVVRLVRAGAGVVRTTDVRAVRRVVTVADRLRAASSSDDRAVTA